MGTVIDVEKGFKLEQEYNAWVQYCRLEEYVMKHQTNLRDEFIRNGCTIDEAVTLSRFTLEEAYKARMRGKVTDNVVEHPRKAVYSTGGLKIEQ